MTDPTVAPVDVSPEAWKIRHRVVAGSLTGIGLLMGCVVVEMFKLNSEAIARDLLALGFPTGATIVLGYLGIKSYENIKIGR